MLAHELRNPLAALSSALALRDRAEPAAPRFVRLQKICNRQVGNLARIIDDLVEISRITSGRIELKREPTELAQIVRNAVQTVRPRIRARRHSLSVISTHAKLLVNADSTRLEQAVASLLENAAKYTEPAGHIEVRIESELRDGQPWGLVRVVDTGRGIPPEMLTRIFDLFTQVDSTIDRAAGGLGIGLTLVRELVRLHGGVVSANSAGLGQGSEFVVALPLLEQKAAATQPVRLSGPAPAGRRRVLIIEDNDDTRETMSELLEDLGHEVEVAADGATGLQKLIAMRPDIAVIDIGLPELDGYEVARRARAAVGAGPYLVALTGYGDAQARTRSEEAGFDLHLIKPIKLETLSSVLEVPTTRPVSEQAPAHAARRRVVLVDDDDDSREALKEVLEELGHEVTTANDGRSGLEKIHQMHPDVALVDISLPDIDGFEVARTIRGEGDRHTGLVALTGFSGPEVTARATQAGFDQHVVKPIRMEELPRIVLQAGPA